jgi:hypothetical protein
MPFRFLSGASHPDTELRIEALREYALRRGDVSAHDAILALG